MWHIIPSLSEKKDKFPNQNLEFKINHKESNIVQ